MNCRREVTRARCGANVWLKSGPVFVHVKLEYEPDNCGQQRQVLNAYPPPGFWKKCSDEGLADEEACDLLRRCEELSTDIHLLRP